LSAEPVPQLLAAAVLTNSSSAVKPKGRVAKNWNAGDFRHWIKSKNPAARR
jgi:hypothetical protein